ncbi:MAG: ABC transporter ATP-binding protein [Bdellovibrionota bacterium]
MKGVSKSFRLGMRDISVLSELTLKVRRGEFVAVMGSSGSGKSTLLHILGALDRPSSGTYLYSESEIKDWDDSKLSQFRSEEIGFIFQKFYLLPQLTVFENVKYPFLYSRHVSENRVERVNEVLAQVGLAHRTSHRPAELSGGEMQRVAIARALVTRPTLILADEPTGNLDVATGEEILLLLKQIHNTGTTMILVTHDPLVAKKADRILILREGRFDS